MTDLDELERLALGGGNRAPNAILRLVAVARAAERLINPRAMVSAYHQRKQREEDESALREALEAK